LSRWKYAEGFLCQFHRKVNIELESTEHSSKEKSAPVFAAGTLDCLRSGSELVAALALFDFKLRAFDRGVCFVFTQTQVSQRSSETIAIGESGKNRTASNGRIPVAQVMREPGRRHELAKGQVRINGERRLVIIAQVICVYVQVIRQTRMPAQFMICGPKIIAGQSRSLETIVRTAVRAIGCIAPANIGATVRSVRRPSQSTIYAYAGRRSAC
jgi:hypothetical protein